MSAGRFRISSAEACGRALRRLSRGLLAVYQAALKHPNLSLVAAILLAATAVSHIGSLRTLVSYRDLFDDGYRNARAFERARELFGDGNPVLLVTRPKDGVWTGEKLCRLRGWLTKQQVSEPEIDEISSAFDLRRTRETGARLDYPRVLDPDCSSREATTLLRGALGTPWEGVLVDRAAEDVAAEIVFRNTPGGSRFGKFDPTPITRVKKDFDAALGDALVPIWTGNSMYDWSMRDGMRRFPFLNLAILLVVLLLYRAYLGTWRSGLMLVLTLILTGTTIYGCMAWVGTPMDILSSGLFMLITVAAHQDFSFVSMHRLERGGDFRWNFRKFVVPSFFTSLTTAAGFGSLCVSDLTVVKRFGFWAASGAMLEWAFVMLFLPALISRVPSLANWVDGNRALFGRGRGGGPTPPWSRKLRDFLPAPTRARALALCAIFLAIPWALTHANFTDDPKGIFPKDHVFRKTFEYLARTRGWESAVDLVFLPEATDAQRDAAVASVRRLDGVARVDRNRDQLEYLQRDLASEGRRDLVRREFSRSRLSGRYLAADGSERALVYVNNSDLVRIRSLVSSIEGICRPAHCEISGPIAMYVEFVYRISRTLIESLFVSLALVLAILAFLLTARRARNGVAVVVASIWGPVAMLIAIAALGISLNTYTCTFASVLVGLTGDNSIQFLLGSRGDRLARGIASRRGGAIFTSVVMSACSLTFLGSVFHPPKVLGLLLFFGFLACLFGDYWVLKGLSAGEA